MKLRDTRKEDYITFGFDSKGKPFTYGEMGESQTNRIGAKKRTPWIQYRRKPN